jgi:ATP-dependent Lhr-like helicase
MKNDNREIRVALIAFVDKPGDQEVPALEAIARDIADHALDSSNLVFANSRNMVEWMSQRLHQIAEERDMPYDPFLSHHGSLSKEVREKTEKALKSGRPFTAVATSSLELGVDIGSVERVIQIASPNTVNSFKQRGGRGGRREGDPTVIRHFTIDRLPIRESTLTSMLYPGLLRGHAMIELLLANSLEPAGKPKFHASTLIHQTLSCVRQWGAVHPDRLFTILCEERAFGNIDADFYAEMLRGLKVHNLIAQNSEGAIVLAQKGDEETSKYDFYAAFNAPEDYTVAHDENTIGLLPAGELPKCGQHIILNGRKWHVDGIRHREKRIEVTPSEAGSVPIFGGDVGDIHTFIFKRMQQALRDDAISSYLDPNAVRLLQAARETARSAGLNERHVLPGDNVLIWFPWVGTRALRTLRLFAQLDKLEAEDDGLALNYKSVSKDRFISHLQRMVSGEVNATQLAALMVPKKFQKFDKFVDEKLLDRANGNDRLDLETAQEAAGQALGELRGTHSLIAV